MKITDIAGLALIGGIGYLLLRGGQDLFSAFSQLNPLNIINDTIETGKQAAEQAAQAAEQTGEAIINTFDQTTGTADKQFVAPGTQTAFNYDFASWLASFFGIDTDALAAQEAAWWDSLKQGPTAEQMQELILATTPPPGQCNDAVCTLTTQNQIDLGLITAPVEDNTPPEHPALVVPPTGLPAGILEVTGHKIRFSTNIINRYTAEDYVRSIGQQPGEFKWLSGKEAYIYFR